MLENYVPLFSEENEKALLSCFLQEGKDKDMRVSMYRQLSPEDFYIEENAIIWTALKSMYKEDKDSIDPITLSAYLRNNGLLEKVTAQYIIQVYSYLSATHNWSHYLKEVAIHSLKRKSYLIGAEVYKMSFDSTVSLLEIKTKLSEGIDTITKWNKPKSKSIKDEIEDVYRKSIDPFITNGIKPPIRELANVVLYEPGSMTCIAARPSVGKTAYAISEMVELAKQGYRCYLVSVEMKKAPLIQRILSNLSGVPLYKMRKKVNEGEQLPLSSLDIERLEEAKDLLMSMPLEIIDEDVSTDDGVMAQLESIRIKESGNEDKTIVYIDYIQLIASSIGNGSNRNNEIERMSRNIKNFAKESSIPVIILSQLKRDSDKPGVKPRLSDLRDSGAIEQDIDTCLMLYRPEMSGIKSDEKGFSTKGVMEVLITKNRQGALDDIEVSFMGEITRVLDRQPKVTYESIKSAIQRRATTTLDDF